MALEPTKMKQQMTERERFRQALMQHVGQSERTIGLLIDKLFLLSERVDRLEQEKQKLAA